MVNNLLVELGIRIAIQLTPLVHLLIPSLTSRSELTVFQVGESHLVWSDHTATGTHLDREVTDGQTLFHRRVADRLTGILHEITRSAAGTHPANDIEGDILCGHTRLTLAVDRDTHRFRFTLHDALRSQGHLYLAGTNTKGDRTHRTVCGGV